MKLYVRSSLSTKLRFRYGSRTTCISLISLLDVDVDVNTSAPEAKDSMSNARREVPRLGSFG
jgi:hypothetical protein